MNLVSSISCFFGNKSGKIVSTPIFDFSRLIRTHATRVRVSRRRSERGGRRRSRGRVRLSALAGVLMGTSKSRTACFTHGFSNISVETRLDLPLFTIKTITRLIALVFHIMIDFRCCLIQSEHHSAYGSPQRSPRSPRSSPPQSPRAGAQARQGR